MLVWRRRKARLVFCMCTEEGWWLCLQQNAAEVGSGRQEGGLQEERCLDLLMQREDSKFVGVTEEDAVERVRWRHLIGCNHTNNYIMYPQLGLLNPKLSTNCSWPQAKTQMYALFGKCHEGRFYFVFSFRSLSSAWIPPPRKGRATHRSRLRTAGIHSPRPDSHCFDGKDAVCSCWFAVWTEQQVGKHS